MKMSKVFTGKIILITGGTGSFGSFIVKNIIKDKPKQVIIFSRDEDKQYLTSGLDLSLAMFAIRIP